MRIAIVHYHLRPAGVTRVIRSAVTSLTDRGAACVVLAGSVPADTGTALINVRAVPGVNYTTEPAPADPLLADHLEEAARSALGGAPDIWHFHNHSLGKNVAVTQAAHELATRGRRMVLQVHDFPEDGRPQNYRYLREQLDDGLAKYLYPTGTHVHYAVLNSRDRSFLVDSGLPSTHVHLLPDPVEPLPAPPSVSDIRSANPRLFLYPTRAIRRKNIGEFLLWSALAGHDDVFATTLAPTSPADIAPYDHWVRFAADHKLPVQFEFTARSGFSYPDLFHGAHAIVTTSVAEGFGLAFAEPWLAGQRLLGRKLPDITPDLEQAGLNLSELYERLDVPLPWIGLDTLRSKVASALRAIFTAYGRTLPRAALDRALNSMVRDDRVDFGRLDEELQEGVLRHVLYAPGDRAKLCPAQLAGTPDKPSYLSDNEEIVRSTFGLDAYGQRLRSMYDQVMNSKVSPLAPLDVDALLDKFLTPERFCLLRT